MEIKHKTWEKKENTKHATHRTMERTNTHTHTHRGRGCFAWLYPSS